MRRPYIAGNWKLWGTRAEARRLLRAAGRAAAGRDPARRRRRRSACPFTALDVVRDEAARHRGARLRAEHAPGRGRGAFTGEISAPMLTELGDRRRRARPLRAPPATSARPTARCRRRCPAALAAGLAADPLRRRDRGGARGGRHRAQAAPPGAGGAREGRRRAAGRGRDRLRADLGDRHRQGRDARAGAGGDRLRARARGRPRAGRGRARARPLRRQRQARERGRDPRAAGRGRRARRRRQPRPGLASRGSWRPCRTSADASRGSAWSSSTAGAWPSRGPATRSSWPTRRSSTSSGREHPHTQLTAWGPAVGLPEGQMGNSEVGHLNLGAGAVVKQDLMRIDEAIADGSFFENEALEAACAAGRESGRLHLLGLVSARRRAREHGPPAARSPSWREREGVPDVVLHAFTDGRDTLPDSGAGCARARPSAGRCAWRTRHRPLLRDGPRPALGPHQARLGRARARPRPTRRTPTAARPRCAPPTSAARPTSSSSRRWSGRRAASATGDAVVFFNFRPDRARQLTRALGEPDFDEFDRGEAPRVSLTTLTEYQEDWDYPVAFPPARPSVTLASVLAERGVDAAARGRDREVRPRDLLLQRRRGAPVRGRGAPAGRLAARRADLRPEAGDARARGGARRSSTRWRERRLRLRDHQLRQPGHGRPHRRDPGRGRRRSRRVDECLGQVVEAVHASGGACVDHRRPRQRRPHARAGRQPEHRPLAEPGAADRHRRRRARCARAASSPTSRRPCSPCSARSSQRR